MSEHHVLLLGLNDSGKTVYGGQLFGRVQEGQGALSFACAPEDLKALEEALMALEQGKPPKRTTRDVYEEVVFPLKDLEGHRIDLIWPDYGGEQVRDLVDERRITSEWQQRIENTSIWFLMIRPHLAKRPIMGIDDPPTLLDHLASAQTEASIQDSLHLQIDQQSSHAAEERSETTTAVEGEHPMEDEQTTQVEGEQTTKITRVNLPTDVQHVELLQLLLHGRDGARFNRRKDPALLVLLSCFDEVKPSTKTPMVVLQEYFPLMSQFIENNWDETAWHVMGLSAQGGSLKEDGKIQPEDPSSEETDESLTHQTNAPHGSYREVFMEQGPSNCGYVVTADGAHDPDLTLPILWALKQP